MLYLSYANEVLFLEQLIGSKISLTLSVILPFFSKFSKNVFYFYM